MAPDLKPGLSTNPHSPLQPEEPGIFPNTESVIRLVGALLAEINDEMVAAERRYIAAASITPLLEKGDQLASLPAAPRN